MENHIFSDPVPFFEGSNQPCWKVDVFRRGVDEPVACLEIHAGNLPPRRGNKKNKVLWKLPDKIEETPRFGAHEKQRLWDLFKQEKKNRRKSKKKGDNNEEDDDLDAAIQAVQDENNSESLNEDSIEVIENPPHKMDRQPDPKIKPPSPGFVPPPPPPGFDEMAKLSLEDPISLEMAQNTSKSPERSSIRPPPGLSKMSPNEKASPPPPHPPGLAPPSPLTSPPLSADVLPRSQIPKQEQQQQPLSAPISPDPRLPICFVFGTLRGSDLKALPPEALSSAIGEQVARILIHALTTPGQLSYWLAHYHDRAQKILLVGAAQAHAHTAADRQQQWESLIGAAPPPQLPVADSTAAATTPPPTAAWDCQGWAAQVVVRSLDNDNDDNGDNDDDNDTNSKHGPIPIPTHTNTVPVNVNGVNPLRNDVEPEPHPPSLLVVLSGRTLQRQEILSYHLTLTLHGVDTRHLPPGSAAHYKICNEILCLARAAG